MAHADHAFSCVVDLTDTPGECVPHPRNSRHHAARVASTQVSAPQQIAMPDRVGEFD
ncbi:hypothetical protein [Paraburkholderia sp. BL10I2N1]|uniref:hypothetical protein n=1 Tax=Paraburkholderia sp. BL10I2N1 TaxID=1938796 RepID=UPI001414EE91|nr:hypothetical protein [Paraburkholderia sp. BL10I2N1]